MKSRSLRSQLILSHILPSLIILPITALALFYVLEKQVLIPQLAQNMIGDARLLAEINRAEYELWGNPIFFEDLLNRVEIDPSLRIMFLDPKGTLLYSSVASDAPWKGLTLNMGGVSMAQSGQEAVLTNYSPWRVNDVLIDVFEPILSPSGSVVGIVRVTYKIASISDLVFQTRSWIVVVLLISTIIGGVLGSYLAIRISRPLQRVTQAIYDLARGNRHEPLEPQGAIEIRQLADAVNYLVEQLRGLEVARRHLLANLVHELGRPLGAIRSAIHALMRGAAHDELLLQELGKGMDEEALRMQKVLDDLARFHDQIIGNLELTYENLDLSTWLRIVLRPWEEAAKEKKLQWLIKIPDSLPLIRADSLRLAQAIGNLADNAIKYTPSGGRIEIEATAEEENILIRIKDNGSGITIEDQARIYEPFYRGEQGSRMKQGMGLGLSIARQIVEAHGGRLELDSEVGVGSEFRIILPFHTT
ncbi:MAG: sensor histidine kinase [Anaerolineales bacterium]